MVTFNLNISLIGLIKTSKRSRQTGFTRTIRIDDGVGGILLNSKWKVVKERFVLKILSETCDCYDIHDTSSFDEYFFILTPS